MMRFPTIKTLRRIHDADHARMRAIGKMTRQELLDIAVCWECERASYGRQPTHYLRLLALNETARCHGIENIESVGGELVEYLNAGDIYAPTLIRWRKCYRVQSIGDFIETMERSGVRFK